MPVTVPSTKPRVWTPPSRDIWAGSGRWRQFARSLETDYWTGRHWARHRGVERDGSDLALPSQV